MTYFRKCLSYFRWKRFQKAVLHEFIEENHGILNSCSWRLAGMSSTASDSVRYVCGRKVRSVHDDSGNRICLWLMEWCAVRWIWFTFGSYSFSLVLLNSTLDEVANRDPAFHIFDIFMRPPPHPVATTPEINRTPIIHLGSADWWRRGRFGLLGKRDGDFPMSVFWYSYIALSPVWNLDQHN